MIKIYLRFICLVFIFMLLQSFINSTKKKSKKSFEKYIAENSAYITKYNLEATINETDSTLELHLENSSTKLLREILYFKNSVCYKDAVYYNCDSCMQKWLKPILEKKTWNWIKVSDKKYVSRRKYVLDITYNERNFSYVLKKEKISKVDYKKLVEIK